MRRVVLRVPELRRDEDVLALEAWDVGEGALQALGDFFLVLVAGVLGGGLIRGGGERASEGTPPLRGSDGSWGLTSLRDPGGGC